MSLPNVRRVSTTEVQPASYIDKNSNSYERIDLNSWDLIHLGIAYMQKGLLFRKPQPQLEQGDETQDVVVHNMISRRHHGRTRLLYILKSFIFVNLGTMTYR